MGTKHKTFHWIQSWAMSIQFILPRGKDFSLLSCLLTSSGAQPATHPNLQG
jgi:hypothetical protein